jgi:uncharacterized protein DUF899
MPRPGARPPATPSRVVRSPSSGIPGHSCPQEVKTLKGNRARGLDGLWGMYQWLDRARKGRNETGIWWRRHDEYNKS